MKKFFTKHLAAAIFCLCALLNAGTLLAQDGECLSGPCAFGGTQFPSGTQTTSSTTFVTVATNIFAGEWQRYSVTTGNTYEWSLCSADGGSASYDSQLSLYNDSNAGLCYSDDLCTGSDAKIRWTATYTGFARTRVNVYNCSTNSTNTTLVWRVVPPPPPNNNCSGATALTSGSPSASGTTNSATQSFAATTCNGFTGTADDDVWYSFTTGGLPTSFTISVTPSGADPIVDAVVHLYSGSCPVSGAGIACADATSGSSAEVITVSSASPNTTYYFRTYSYGTGATSGTFTAAVSSGAFPIELKSFTGKTDGSANMLYWETLTERNVAWHVVERSLDNAKWAEVGRLEGQQESSNLKKYELADHQPLAKAYYRLRSVDLDGSENVSDAILLTRKGAGFGIEAAYPSPTSSALTVQFTALREETVTIRLVDLMGRVVLEQQFEATDGLNEVPLQIGALQTGVYNVTIANELQISAPLRVVKQ
jgi:Secretion system C-terminal sorting domain